jgi:8-oxo-dGTP pyrophosphatase MutT (NUDIX family)
MSGDSPAVSLAFVATRLNLIVMDSLKQVAAMPVRKGNGGGIEILLVTSRETGRWVIPKGWPSRRMKDSAAAAREAKEEAGVTGKIARKPFGIYRYRKLDGEISHIVDVSVFLLKVKKERKRWSEQAERQRAWFPLEIASRRVREPKLKLLILGLRQGRSAA